MSSPLTRRRYLALTGAAGVLGLAGCLGSDDVPDGVEVETLTEDVDTPWGLAFQPEESGLLVTEIGGTLKQLDPEERTVETITGTPEVYAAGQGGLLDVALGPDFPEKPWIYLTYVAQNDAGESATHLGRGRLDGGTLRSFEQLHVAEPFVDSTGHYGSRVIAGPDGKIYMTTGDRQSKDFGPDHHSQDKTNELGATLRLEPDGSIPADNPFLDEAADSIYSYGHRNAQGMAIHPDSGAIWQSEHGERDGDEINVIERGGNYGWPVTHYGCAYGSTDPVGDQPAERDDVVDPVYYWECESGGFPPAGATFYDHDTIPGWEGDLFVGNLAGQYLGRFDVDGRDVDELDPLLADRGWRIRDVTVGPETGYLYVAVDSSDGPIVRLTPE